MTQTFIIDEDGVRFDPPLEIVTGFNAATGQPIIGFIHGMMSRIRRRERITRPAYREMIDTLRWEDML